MALDTTIDRLKLTAAQLDMLAGTCSRISVEALGDTPEQGMDGVGHDGVGRDGVGHDGVGHDGIDGAGVRLLAISDRLSRAVERLEQSLEAEANSLGALAAEADHRIKNNLQMVSSLLWRQARASTEAPVAAALKVAAGRVEAVAQVHAALHDRTGRGGAGLRPAELDLSRFLGRLCKALGSGMGLGGEADGGFGGGGRLAVSIESQLVDPHMARCLGQIVSELVTNALRHAFVPGQAGTVWVEGKKLGDERYSICVRDDGRGLPPELKLREAKSGLGLRLIDILVDQVGGRMEIGRAGRGGMDGEVVEDVAGEVAGEVAGGRFTLVFPVNRR